MVSFIELTYDTNLLQYSAPNEIKPANLLSYLRSYFDNTLLLLSFIDVTLLICREFSYLLNNLYT